MKEPNPIYFEYESEYYNAMEDYKRYLFKEECKRLNRRNAVIGWSLVIFTFGLICLSFYLYI